MKKTLALILACCCSTVAFADDVIWDDRPGDKWENSWYPLGNGRLGCMVDGGARKLRIQFNVDSLWTGDKNLTNDIGDGEYVYTQTSAATNALYTVTFTNTREEGIHVGRFLRDSYWSEYKIDGRPYRVTAKAKAAKYFALGDRDHMNVKVGAEYDVDGNRGDGLSYDEAFPPQGSAQHTLRPRAFSDIPSLQTLSGYVSDRASTHIGNIGATIEAGVRLSNLFLDRDKSGGVGNKFVAEPRVNASLSLLNRDNQSIFDDLSLTGGYGLSNKMPTLLYLYPDKAYYDYPSLTKWGATEADRLGLMNTKIISETQNPSLRPIHTQKWEAGISFRIGKMNGFVTYFNEQHRHEFGFAADPFIFHTPQYIVPATATAPHYDSATGSVTYTDDAGIRQTADVRWNDFFNLASEGAAAAQDADLCVLCLGLDRTVEGEDLGFANDFTDCGDRKTLMLPKCQQQLAEKICDVCENVIVVVLCGSCADLGERVRNHAKAVIHAWYPGALGGLAIANTIAGVCTPSGKLPITFYHADDELPDIENYDMHDRTYRFLQKAPLYPFSYGLSYTDFAYRDAQVVSADPAKIVCDITVENTGSTRGRAVVQCYARYTDSRTTTPKLQLCGVSSVKLEPGEAKHVCVQVDRFWVKAVLDDGSRVEPDGKVLLYLGGGQPDQNTLCLRIKD